MRYGFTTGSCAAAAAKAAAYMLLAGKVKTEITIETPKGIHYTAQILKIERGEKEVSCAVEKEGGENYTIAKMNIPTEFLINGFVTSANLAYKADYATLAESALKANSAEYATKANKAFNVGDLDTGLVQVKLEMIVLDKFFI